MILKCIRYITKENLLLLKDLSELERLKSTNTWQQYQKNVYITKLGEIINEYNNTCHRTIKMKPVDEKNNTYIDFKKEVYDKHPEFKVIDHVRISKYKNIFAKGYTPNWSK